ncbi:efflux RND transporter periplasmic adaptor subunit [Sphingobacterium paramultivorum]|uniref:Efflux RND transporter periplasmic adaptor subunit n=1 Tax=Sphingobacterium paramultivorum TaxID=2886510 RepID=A0A7G5E0Y5_9SPHI|nr:MULTISPECIES: efflux RND transporter periplasmic adaptor subunit [Sphingobacterium]MCS4165051.1 RND family efflux transporter MFP subunit [Sphingobacterium sp. BIGb0116]QMV67660.1 efflux RND transporter periplasmic adaptor subunit [Sphingobacterium paramultivorum]WSO16541.1 efflux RND transporter periplasmic adaptor subunit [Sphingobacterium paramultivorum]
MKVFIKIFIVCIAVTVFYGCGSNESERKGQPEGKEAPKSEEGHEEGPVTVAALSAAQIKAVGIVFGGIEEKELTATIKANGLLSVPNNNKANATTLYGGVVKTLNVQLGDNVRKGQVIATITNPQFVQLQEEYVSLASKITLAEQEMARQQELNEGNAGARKNLQAATADFNSLRARKASLQQQIQLMGINPNSVNLSNMRTSLAVTSPINGTVSNVFAKIGSYVDVSSPVIEIVDNSLLHLDLQVFEKDLPLVKVGQLINFQLTNNPDKTYTAKVFTIGSSFENDSKTIAVHSTVVGSKVGLIDGMNITGMIGVNNVRTPAVPNDAIVEADGKYYIFVETDKKPEEHEEGHDDHGHAHDEGEAKHAHKNEQEAGQHGEEQAKNINFEKIEIQKGVSALGYTAIIPVTEVPAGTKIVVKGAFFINAKMSNTGGHEH